MQANVFIILAILRIEPLVIWINYLGFNLNLEINYILTDLFARGTVFVHFLVSEKRNVESPICKWNI